MTYIITITKSATHEVTDEEVRDFHDISEEFWASMSGHSRRIAVIEYASHEKGRSFEPAYNRQIDVEASTAS